MRKEFSRYLKRIRGGNKSEKQKKHWLISICFLTGNDAITFEDDYGSMIFETKRKAAGEQPKPTEQEATEPTKGNVKRKIFL